MTFDGGSGDIAWCRGAQPGAWVPRVALAASVHGMWHLGEQDWLHRGRVGQREESRELDQAGEGDWSGSWQRYGANLWHICQTGCLPV